MEDEADRLFEELDEDCHRTGGPDLHASLTVRPATSQDAEPLGRLSAEREGGDAGEHRAAFTRAIESDEHGRSSLVLVAEVEGDVVGFGKARHLGESRSEQGDVAPEGWYLTGVVVDSRFRRRGVGSRLTAERLKWISERSRFAHYFSNARNPVSIALHARFGFVEVARGSEFAGVTFVGGEGVLFRADLTGDDERIP
jgi:ribosomal protein S18 acetylase RimI-like enzyme